MKNFKILAITFSGLLVLLAVFLMDGLGDKERENQLTVFAASSFAWVLHEQEEFIEGKTGLDIVIVEAASSTLARQIARGAPADVFIAADAVWLNYLAEGGHYEAEPVEIARNRLVWVRTFSSEQIEEIRKTIEKFKNESGEKGIVSVQGDWGQASVFITGDPDYVPLGQYAKEALINMGMWESHQNRLIPAKNSRQAVFLIETQAPAEGVIYLTDALASENIMVFNEIPQDSHTPIVYWAVAVKQSNSGKTKKFLDFLKSEDFKTILQSKGFEVN